MGVTGSLAQKVGPYYGAATEYLLAGVCSLMVAACRGQLTALKLSIQWKYAAPCILFLILNNAMFWIAVSLATSSMQIAEVGVVNYLWPSLTLLLAIPIVGRKVRPAFYAGVFLAAVGVCIPLVEARGITFVQLSDHVRDNPWPYLIIFLSALSWAVYSNLSARFADRVNVLMVIVAMLMEGAAFLLIGLCITANPQWSPAAIGEALYVGVGAAIAYLSWDLSMRRGNQILVAALSYFTGVLSTLFTSLYLGITPGVGLWCGAMLVCIGAWCAKRNIA